MENNQVVIFVGDVTNDLEKTAKRQYPNAQLITHQNYQNLAAGAYYTSLGDFERLIDFVNCLDQADQLIYSPPVHWSSPDMSRWTEYYMMYFYSRKTVIYNTNKSSKVYLELEDQRQTDDPQLWIAGCSFSHGVGVETHERYGSLLSRHLNLPASFLTKPGSSIAWAGDQILRSDIRKNDTVVWGLTSSARFAFFDKKIVHVNSAYYQTHPEFTKIINIDRLDDENMRYQCLTRIHQVINFCNKIQARLLIAGLLMLDDFQPFVYDLPNFLQLYGGHAFDHTYPYLDHGSDGHHPGPLTHQWYTDQIFKKLQMLDYGKNN